MEAYEEIVPFHNLTEIPELKMMDLIRVLENIQNTDGELRNIVILTEHDPTATKNE